MLFDRFFKDISTAELKARELPNNYSELERRARKFPNQSFANDNERSFQSLEITATLSLKIAGENTIHEHWMLVVAASETLSASDCQRFKISSVGSSNLLALDGVGININPVNNGPVRFNLNTPLVGEVILGRLGQTPPKFTIGVATFKSKTDYTDWLKSLHNKQLPVKPTEIGGNCLDFVEMALQAAMARGAIDAAKLKVFTDYKKGRYPFVKANTWDKMWFSLKRFVRP